MRKGHFGCSGERLGWKQEGVVAVWRLAGKQSYRTWSFLRVGDRVTHVLRMSSRFPTWGIFTELGLQKGDLARCY